MVDGDTSAVIDDPETMAAYPVKPVGIAVDEGYVYWTTNEERLFKAPRSRRAPRAQPAATSQPFPCALLLGDHTPQPPMAASYQVEGDR